MDRVCDVLAELETAARAMVSVAERLSLVVGLGERAVDPPMLARRLTEIAQHVEAALDVVQSMRTIVTPADDGTCEGCGEPWPCPASERSTDGDACAYCGRRLPDESVPA